MMQGFDGKLMVGGRNASVKSSLDRLSFGSQTIPKLDVQQRGRPEFNVSSTQVESVLKRRYN